MYKSRLLLPAVLVVSSFSANAEIITVNYSGTLTDVGSLFGATASVGDAMTGSFSYDTAGGGGILSMTVSFGAFTASLSGSGSTTVQNDQMNGSATNPADGFILRGSSTSDSLNGYSDPYMQFGLLKDNLDGQLWDDTLLPDSVDWANITLADINKPDWRILDFGVANTASFRDDQIRWSVDGFTVSQVPVPAAVWLFGSGLIGLFGVARRKAI